MPLTSDPRILFHKTERAALILGVKHAQLEEQLNFHRYMQHIDLISNLKIDQMQHRVNDCCRLHPPIGRIYYLPDPSSNINKPRRHEQSTDGSQSIIVIISFSRQMSGIDDH